MMNKIIVLVFIISLAVPQTTFAVWWNPLTWFNKKTIIQQQAIQNILPETSPQALSTTTVKITTTTNEQVTVASSSKEDIYSSIFEIDTNLLESKEEEYRLSQMKDIKSAKSEDEKQFLMKLANNDKKLPYSLRKEMPQLYKSGKISYYSNSVPVSTNSPFGPSVIFVCPLSILSLGVRRLTNALF